MSVTAPRCHLCLDAKTSTPSGALICEHCDNPCRVGTSGKPCQKCLQGDKSQGRGPQS